MVLLSSSISLLTFCPIVLSIVMKGMLKSLDRTGFISPFNSISFCFTCFAALLFDVYTFRIAVSSWRIDPLSLHCSCWSVTFFFSLKFVLSNVNIATSTFF